MLTIFHLEEGCIVHNTVEKAPEKLPESAVWIDLFSPSSGDEAAVERLLNIDVPTREEMQEIEASSRLYMDEGAMVMTMPVLSRSATAQPESAAITFILAGDRLVTVRYTDPVSFGMFIRRLNRQPVLAASGEQALIGLLEQIADRLADILEGATAGIETLSHEIFRNSEASPNVRPDLKLILQRIGHVGDLASKAKDSLLGLNRLMLFFSAQRNLNKDAKARAGALMQDAISIADHATFLASKIGFLLDATLGMINIEQNNIIKLFTVAAVAFLPPTLIASIYGMNFTVFPELTWPLGYPFALGLMLFSAIVPLLYFRSKKWL